jgi:hypothetical protein
VGRRVGFNVGGFDGFPVVTFLVGLGVGFLVDFTLGLGVGFLLGFGVGAFDAFRLGAGVGFLLDLAEGFLESANRLRCARELEEHTFQVSVRPS